MTETVVLTFDFDWCQDDALNYTLNKLIKDEVPATFFVTHRTKLIDEIRKYNFFELGIHPNFSNDSTHGSNYKNIISHCLSIVPEAKSSRSHGLHISSNILTHMSMQGIKIDCSTFMPNISNFENFYFEINDKKILRIPYNWEDDYEFYQKKKKYNFSDVNHYKTLIMDFHPIHVFLNSSSIGEYEKHKQGKGYNYSKNQGTENMLDEIIKEYIKGNIKIKNLNNFANIK